MEHIRIFKWITMHIMNFFLLLSLGLSVAYATPRATVEEAINRLLDTLRLEQEALRENPSRVNELVEEVIAAYVDFSRMSQLVLGKL